jgi:hypothetical protein
MCSASRRLLFLEGAGCEKALDGATAGTGVCASEVSGEAKLHQNAGAKELPHFAIHGAIRIQKKKPGVAGLF